MDYHVAATDEEVTKSAPRGGYRPKSTLLQQRQFQPPPPAVNSGPRPPRPKGVTHAVREGQKETVCGIPLARLIDFPEMEWPPSNLYDRCLMCREWVKAEITGR